MLTDPLADCFSRLRNASAAKLDTVSIPYSRLKEGALRVLKTEGMVSDVSIDEKDKGKKNIVVQIKYDSHGKPVLQKLNRVSTPGQRVYTAAPKGALVRSGMGFQILSTSKGIMTDRDAIEQNVGGEVLGEAW